MRIEAVNDIISTYADGDRVRYLNMRDQFQVEIGQVIPDLFTDGLHLSNAGYQMWADTMDPIFQELMKFDN
jgi:lysophospholipase L1-like esterase